jgi:hypothetical protein
MMDPRDQLILWRLRNVCQSAGDFTTGILTNELPRDEQIRFAHKLVDLAEAIRDKVAGPFGVVIEGSMADDSATTDGDSSRTTRDA